MATSISLAILVGQFWRKMAWSSENENQGMQNEKVTIFINEIEIEEVEGWVVVHFLVW